MLDREFFLGCIRIHFLYHASVEPSYGVKIARELARHGYHISPGTLYPVLHRLTERGYMEGFSRLVSGKIRKYYRATDEGVKALERSKKKIIELVGEVIEGEDCPET